jgi:hypothetical protein
VIVIFVKSIFGFVTLTTVGLSVVTLIEFITVCSGIGVFTDDDATGVELAALAVEARH